MKTQKMSLANIQGKLTRTEMKNIMAGVGCGQYEGQTTYVCGSIVNGNNVYLDYCYCNGNPVPGGCEVLQQD